MLHNGDENTGRHRHQLNGTGLWHDMIIIDQHYG
jgi:hypothetical protein